MWCTSRRAFFPTSFCRLVHVRQVTKAERGQGRLRYDMVVEFVWRRYHAAGIRCCRFPVVVFRDDATSCDACIDLPQTLFRAFIEFSGRYLRFLTSSPQRRDCGNRGGGVRCDGDSNPDPSSSAKPKPQPRSPSPSLSLFLPLPILSLSSLPRQNSPSAAVHFSPPLPPPPPLLPPSPSPLPRLLRGPLTSSAKTPDPCRRPPPFAVEEWLPPGEETRPLDENPGTVAPSRRLPALLLLAKACFFLLLLSP